MELPEGKPVLIFVFNIMNPTQANTDDCSMLIHKEFLKNGTSALHVPSFLKESADK
jgi:hypothetical protein